LDTIPTASRAKRCRALFVDDALRLCLELADTNRMNRVHDKLINHHFIHSVSDEKLWCADELRDAAGREADKRY
jgi:hypothetical protein